MINFKNILHDFIYVFYNSFVCNIPSWTIRKFLYKCGGMKIGQGSRIMMKTTVIKPWKIVIGERSYINENCSLDGRGGLYIGDDTSISIFTILITGTHDRHTFEYRELPIYIGDHVWIGARATILPGSILENKCLIGAGSTIKSGRYETDIFYSGVPAVQILKRDSVEYRQGNWNPWFR